MEEEHTYNRLSVPSITSRHTSVNSDHTAGYSPMNDDVFEEEYANSNLIEQIEMAQIGNLIQTDNLQIT